LYDKRRFVTRQIFSQTIDIRRSVSMAKGGEKPKLNRKSVHTGKCRRSTQIKQDKLISQTSLREWIIRAESVIRWPYMS